MKRQVTLMRRMMKKVLALLFVALLTGLFFSPSVWPAGRTTVRNIRVGIHESFTRVVFDSEGARPLRVGPASSGQISIPYGELHLLVEANRIFRKGRGAVAKAVYRKAENASTITIIFKYPHTQVNTFFLSADPPQEGGYRLVLDFYPPQTPLSNETQASSVKQAAVKDPGAGEEVPKAASALGATLAVRSGSRGVQEAQVRNDEDLPSASPAEKDSQVEPVLTGEASVILRDPDVEGNEARFNQYRDLTQILAGDLNVRYENEEKGFLQFNALGIGQDDLYLHGDAGLYGKGKIEATYDKIPHRFVTDAKTLYSGVGTENLTLDDTLQFTLENTAFPGVANQLTSFFNSNAVSGDPQFTRNTGTLGFDATALDPWRFHVEVRRTERDGTRPYWGSFGLANSEGMEELLEPIDDETTELRVTGEYAKRPFQFNVTYYLSLFKNNNNTLTWDNPLRLNDIVGGPSRGLSDLAPDNLYHNASLFGSLMDLPLNTRLSLNAAWGLMRQDDDLVPFTINSAIASPPLPAQSVDAEVRTSLYDFRLTSRPLDYFHANGRFRHFEYDNKTQEITFPQGYVVSDSFLNPNPVKNLPVSYKKTMAGADLGFDVSSNSRFNLGYTFERIRRENREVARQDDQVFRGSFDVRPTHWLDLRASYKRTERDISDYDYTVPLEGGGADTQEPLLRKYTQADMVRDQAEFLAVLYPTDALSLSGAFTYGKDDFEESPFGLLEDTHYSTSFDASYSLTNRANLHAFYTHERYKNRQSANGSVGPTVSEWFAENEDRVHTVGAGIDISLIPKRLDLSVSYSLSDVDGDIHFFAPAQDTSDFPIVDETRLQILNAKLKCHVGKGFYVTLGYLYEKFDFDDFQNQGFTNVPTDTAGLYNGALLKGTLTESYKANVGYVKISYKF
jgi:MtrB/PioB family decaheme-associated outer membrane protein